MKELDKSKKYDLSKLNNEQLEEFYDKYYKKENSFYAFKKLINGFHFMYIDDCDYWTFNSNKFKHDFTITCATELFEDEVTITAEAPKEVFNPQQHYFNEPKQFRSLFELSHILELNDWEFDILKRLVRCRKKGQFVQDIKKIKDTADIYLNEFKEK